jgi:hypothetical protein
LRLRFDARRIGLSAAGVEDVGPERQETGLRGETEVAEAVVAP